MLELLLFYGTVSYFGEDVARSFETNVCGRPSDPGSKFPEDHRALYYLLTLLILKGVLVQAATTDAARALGHG